MKAANIVSIRDVAEGSFCPLSGCHGIGKVSGPRRAVEIGPFDVRLPDVLFIRKDRLIIDQEKAVKGAPDLVIEVVSPNDRKADILAAEADYRTIGVPEILFVSQKRRVIRVLRRNESGNYAEEILNEGDT